MQLLKRTENIGPLCYGVNSRIGARPFWYMNEYNIPRYFIGEQKEIPPASVVPYHANKSTIKNRIVLTAHVFSFLTEGSKEIVMGDATTKLNQNEFVLITAGRCFMSEKTSNAGKFSTTLLFFDNNLLQTFFESHEAKIKEVIKKNHLVQKEILLFRNDDFTKSFVHSLTYVADKSEELVKVKLREIL